MADQLRDRTFLSTAVTESGVPRPMAAGSRVMLWFTPDGRLVAGAGCNSIQGQVELSGGQIWMPEGRMTEMWCGDDLNAQDQWLTSLLESRPSWRLSGPHLRVSSGQVVIELTDRQALDPDRPVDGTSSPLPAPTAAGSRSCSEPPEAHGLEVSFRAARG